MIEKGVALTIEERTLVVDALRSYAANLSGFLGKVRTASEVARLEKRVEQIRSLAVRLESSGGGEGDD